MRAVATVQGTSALKVLEHAERAGVARDALLAAAGLGAAAVSDPEARIPFRALVKLYDEAARRSGDDAFGLHVGAASHPRMFDAIGHAALASHTLGAAFAQVLRFYRVLQEGARLDLAVDDGVACVRYTIVDPSVAACRHEVEATIGIVFRFIESATGRALVPAAVRFTHRAPRATREHVRVFRVAPRFAAAANELAFDAGLLDAPLVDADPTLARMFERLLARMLERLPAADGIVPQVRERIAAALRPGPPSAAALARGLGLSARSLQRRLQAEGTSFRAVIDDVRRELALGLVEDSAIGFEEVAGSLGYADAAAFHRAFRRWTGGTALARRRRARARALRNP